MYLFSIVMPIYNVDRWLEEAFYSIVNQKEIDFEKEVEVILVNDCSPDKSKEICLNLCKKYSNVKYFENPINSGSSVARNAGLSKATGQYINFFDADDILSENTLIEVKKFILNNDEKIAHISIPLVYFEAAHGLHPKYKFLGNKNRIIDLKKEPANFILSSASSFYKRSDILNAGLKFDESLFCEEDTKLNFDLYGKVCPKFAYICEKGVSYKYRRRKSGNSQVDQGKVKKEAYYTLIKILKDIQINNEIPKEVFYELCIYDLRARLKNIKESIFDDKHEFEKVINCYREIIKVIPIEFIKSKTKFLSFEERIVFLSEIYDKPLEIREDGYVYKKECLDHLFRVNDLPVDIKKISVTDNELEIETVLNLYGNDDIRLVLLEETSKRVVYPIKEYDTESIYIKAIDSIKSSKTVRYSKFIIPSYLKARYKLYFKNKNTGYLHICNKVQTYSENPFLPVAVFNSNCFKKYTSHKTSINFTKRTIIIEEGNLIGKLIDRIKSVKTIYAKYGKFKWLRFFRFGEPRYWLFNDRPINANDNAEILFTYVNKFYPSIAKNSYYVLSKKSPEIERLSKIGKVVIQNSLKHKFLYLNSKYILTSHLATSFFKPFSIKFLKFYNDLFDTKIIWLQHGITMNDIESAANKFNKQIDKLTISAKFEELIFNNKKYFFDRRDILNTGFARYDNLQNHKTRKILIMPSWRSYLSGKILPNGMHASIDGFTESEYYHQYSKLLTNPKLSSFLEKNRYTLVFVLHPGLRQYAKYFTKFTTKNIQIITNSSVSYSELFSSSCLMVTDYSSVFFDFVYLHKPCIFFQFDREEFFKKHYKEGLFKFKTMGPGPICSSDAEVVQQIIDHANNGMTIQQKYLDKLDEIYLFHDKMNCHRIVKELI